MTSTDNSDTETGAPAEPSGAHQIRVAVDAALDRKAEQLMVLDLAAISDFTDHFLIRTGTHQRQLQAIAENVIGKLRDRGLRPLHVEGLSHGRWVLLDYGGEMVVHIFLDETRSFYALERLWSDAPDVTSQFVQ